MTMRTALKSNEYGRLARGAVATAADVSEDTADVIVKDAQQRAPERTGNLKRSIKKRQEGIAWLVEATVPYAARIEYGYNGTDSRGRTYHNAAQPYLTPASEAARSGYVEKLRRGLEL